MPSTYVTRIALKITGFKYEDGTMETFRFSNTGFVANIDDGAEYYYDPFIETNIILKDEVEDGSLSLQNGLSLNLINDGSLDYLVNYAFDGYHMEVYISRETAPNPRHFYLMYQGGIEKLLVRYDRVIIDGESVGERLSTAINNGTFTGVPDDYEGGPELKDRAKPRIIGQVFNITPVLIKPNTLIYGTTWDVDGNREPILSMSAPRDGGLGLSLKTNAPGSINGDFSTTVLMDAFSPNAGDYVTCLSEGTFKIGASPVYGLTVDIHQATDTYTAWIQRVTIELGFAGYVIHSAPDYLLGSYFTGLTGYKAADDVLSQALDIFAWLGFDGYLNVAVVRDLGLEEPKARFVEAGLNLEDDLDIPVFEIQRANYVIPPESVRLQWKKNNTVQTQAELAGLANDQEAKAIYKEEGSYVSELLNCTPDPYPVNEDFEYKTAIQEEADAIAAATDWIYFRRRIRDKILVVCPILAANNNVILGVIQDGSTDYLNISSTTVKISSTSYLISHNNTNFSGQRMLRIGDIVTLNSNRFNYDDHRFVVYGVIINTRTMQVTYALDGAREISECLP